MMGDRKCQKRENGPPGSVQLIYSNSLDYFTPTKLPQVRRPLPSTTLPVNPQTKSLGRNLGIKNKLKSLLISNNNPSNATTPNNESKTSHLIESLKNSCLAQSNVGSLQRKQKPVPNSSNTLLTPTRLGMSTETLMAKNFDDRHFWKCFSNSKSSLNIKYGYEFDNDGSELPNFFGTNGRGSSGQHRPDSSVLLDEALAQRRHLLNARSSGVDMANEEERHKMFVKKTTSDANLKEGINNVKKSHSMSFQNRYNFTPYNLLQNLPQQDVFHHLNTKTDNKPNYRHSASSATLYRQQDFSTTDQSYQNNLPDNFVNSKSVEKLSKTRRKMKCDNFESMAHFYSLPRDKNNKSNSKQKCTATSKDFVPSPSTIDPHTRYVRGAKYFEKVNAKTDSLGGMRTTSSSPMRKKVMSSHSFMHAPIHVNKTDASCQNLAQRSEVVGINLKEVPAKRTRKKKKKDQPHRSRNLAPVDNSDNGSSSKGSSSLEYRVTNNPTCFGDSMNHSSTSTVNAHCEKLSDKIESKASTTEQVSSAFKTYEKNSSSDDKVHHDLNTSMSIISTSEPYCCELVPSCFQDTDMDESRRSSPLSYNNNNHIKSPQGHDSQQVNAKHKDEKDSLGSTIRITMTSSSSSCGEDESFADCGGRKPTLSDYVDSSGGSSTLPPSTDDCSLSTEVLNKSALFERNNTIFISSEDVQALHQKLPESKPHMAQNMNQVKSGSWSNLESMMDDSSSFSSRSSTSPTPPELPAKKRGRQNRGCHQHFLQYDDSTIDAIIDNIKFVEDQPQHQSITVNNLSCRKRSELGYYSLNRLHRNRGEGKSSSSRILTRSQSNLVKDSKIFSSNSESLTSQVTVTTAARIPSLPPKRNEKHKGRSQTNGIVIQNSTKEEPVKMSMISGSQLSNRFNDTLGFASRMADDNMECHAKNTNMKFDSAGQCGVWRCRLESDADKANSRRMTKSNEGNVKFIERVDDSEDDDFDEDITTSSANEDELNQIYRNKINSSFTTATDDSMHAQMGSLMPPIENIEDFTSRRNEMHQQSKDLLFAKSIATPPSQNSSIMTASPLLNNNNNDLQYHNLSSNVIPLNGGSREEIKISKANNRSGINANHHLKQEGRAGHNEIFHLDKSSDLREEEDSENNFSHPREETGTSNEDRSEGLEHATAIFIPANDDSYPSTSEYVDKGISDVWKGSVVVKNVSNDFPPNRMEKAEVGELGKLNDDKMCDDLLCSPIASIDNTNRADSSRCVISNNVAARNTLYSPLLTRRESGIDDKNIISRSNNPTISSGNRRSAAATAVVSETLCCADATQNVLNKPLSVVELASRGEVKVISSPLECKQSDTEVKKCTDKRKVNELIAQFESANVKKRSSNPLYDDIQSVSNELVQDSTCEQNNVNTSSVERSESPHTQTDVHTVNKESDSTSVCSPQYANNDENDLIEKLRRTLHTHLAQDARESIVDKTLINNMPPSRFQQRPPSSSGGRGYTSYVFISSSDPPPPIAHKSSSDEDHPPSTTVTHNDASNDRSHLNLSGQNSPRKGNGDTTPKRQSRGQTPTNCLIWQDDRISSNISIVSTESSDISTASSPAVNGHLDGCEEVTNLSRFDMNDVSLPKWATLSKNKGTDQQDDIMYQVNDGISCTTHDSDDLIALKNLTNPSYNPSKINNNTLLSSNPRGQPPVLRAANKASRKIVLGDNGDYDRNNNFINDYLNTDKDNMFNDESSVDQSCDPDSLHDGTEDYTRDVFNDDFFDPFDDGNEDFFNDQLLHHNEASTFLTNHHHGNNSNYAMNSLVRCDDITDQRDDDMYGDDGYDNVSNQFESADSSFYYTQRLPDLTLHTILEESGEDDQSSSASCGRKDSNASSYVNGSIRSSSSPPLTESKDEQRKRYLPDTSSMVSSTRFNNVQSEGDVFSTRKSKNEQMKETLDGVRRVEIVSDSYDSDDSNSDLSPHIHNHVRSPITVGCQLPNLSSSTSSPSALKLSSIESVYSSNGPKYEPKDFDLSSKSDKDSTTPQDSLSEVDDEKIEDHLDVHFDNNAADEYDEFAKDNSANLRTVPSEIYEHETGNDLTVEETPESTSAVVKKHKSCDSGFACSVDDLHAPNRHGESPSFSVSSEDGPRIDSEKVNSDDTSSRSSMGAVDSPTPLSSESTSSNEKSPKFASTQHPSKPVRNFVNRKKTRSPPSSTDVSSSSRESTPQVILHQTILLNDKSDQDVDTSTGKSTNNVSTEEENNNMVSTTTEHEKRIQSTRNSSSSSTVSSVYSERLIDGGNLLSKTPSKLSETMTQSPRLLPPPHHNKRRSPSTADRFSPHEMNGRRRRSNGIGQDYRTSSSESSETNVCGKNARNSPQSPFIENQQSETPPPPPPISPSHITFSPLRGHQRSSDVTLVSDGYPSHITQPFHSSNSNSGKQVIYPLSPSVDKYPTSESPFDVRGDIQLKFRIHPTFSSTIHRNELPSSRNPLTTSPPTSQASFLEVFVIQCRNLAPVDLKRNRSDPYVKAYLLPDRSKGGKQKTKVRKHTLNPFFNEILTFPLDDTVTSGHNRTNHPKDVLTPTEDEMKAKLMTSNRNLWLTVLHQSDIVFGKNVFLGQLLISLRDVASCKLNNKSGEWFTLQPKSLVRKKLSLIETIDLMPTPQMTSSSSQYNLITNHPSRIHRPSKLSISVRRTLVSPPTKTSVSNDGQVEKSEEEYAFQVLIKEGRNLFTSNGHSSPSFSPICKCTLRFPKTSNSVESSPMNNNSNNFIQRRSTSIGIPSRKNESNVIQWNQVLTFRNLPSGIAAKNYPQSPSQYISEILAKCALDITVWDVGSGSVSGRNHPDGSSGGGIQRRETSLLGGVRLSLYGAYNTDMKSGCISIPTFESSGVEEFNLWREVTKSENSSAPTNDVWHEKQFDLSSPNFFKKVASHNSSTVDYLI